MLPHEGTVTQWITENVVMPYSARGQTHDPTVSPQWTEIFNAVKDTTKRCLTIIAPPGGGKTGALECILSYIVGEQPGPTGYASQTNETAEFWMETRLLECFKATEKVKALLPRDSAKIKRDQIIFSHMPFVLGGANMTNFQEKSLQYALGDEVWEWRNGLVGELEARLHDRWNGKLILMSQGGFTHTELEERFLNGDQNYYGFTCPVCGEWNRFTWSLIGYEKKYKSDGNLSWSETDKTVKLTCASCPTSWEDESTNRRKLANLGSYVPHNKDHVTDWFSYQFSAFSVWQIPWAKMVRQWILANEQKALHDMEPLRIFVMKRMVEFADAEVIEKLESEPLFMRRESYGPDEMPKGVLVLTAGVDVQDDRLEVGVEGWGKGEENWGVEYKIFMGDPTSSEVWQDLEDFRQTTFRRSDGTLLQIACMCVDTGRHSDDVYDYCRPRQVQKVFAVKGSSVANMPIASRPKRSGVTRAKLFMVGTDTAKTQIYAQLQMQLPAGHRPEDAVPGYIHFPNTDSFDEVYFKQLTSEKVVAKIVKGERRKEFEKHGRNETLDCKVYARAALRILNPNFEKLALKNRHAKSPKTNEQPPNDPPDAETGVSSVPVQGREGDGQAEAPLPRKRVRRRPSGFMAGIRSV